MSVLPGCMHSRNAPILAPEELMSRVCTRRSAACDRCWETLSPTTIFVLLTLRLSNALVPVLFSIPVAAVPTRLAFRLAAKNGGRNSTGVSLLTVTKVEGEARAGRSRPARTASIEIVLSRTPLRRERALRQRSTARPWRFPGSPALPRRGFIRSPAPRLGVIF